MYRFRTALTDLLGLETPIVQAPMSAAASPALVAVVSKAGGLGMISSTWRKADDLRRVIRDVRTASDRSFGVNLGLEWPQEERVDICLEEGVRIFSLFWGDPSALIRRAHDGGARVMQTVGSAEARAGCRLVRGAAPNPTERHRRHMGTRGPQSPG